MRIFPQVIELLHLGGLAVPLHHVFKIIAIKQASHCFCVMMADGIIHLLSKRRSVGLGPLFSGRLYLRCVPVFNGGHGFFVFLILSHGFGPLFFLFIEGLYGSVVLSVGHALIVALKLGISPHCVGLKLPKGFLLLLGDFVLESGLILSELIVQRLNGVFWDTGGGQLLDFLPFGFNVLGHLGHSSLIGRAGLLFNLHRHGGKEPEGFIFSLLQFSLRFLNGPAIGVYSLCSSPAAGKSRDGAIADKTKFVFPLVKVMLPQSAFRITGDNGVISNVHSHMPRAGDIVTGGGHVTASWAIPGLRILEHSIKGISRSC